MEPYDFHSKTLLFNESISRYYPTKDLIKINKVTMFNKYFDKNSVSSLSLVSMEIVGKGVIKL